MVLECISLLFTCRVNLLPPVSFLSGNFINKYFDCVAHSFLETFLPTPPEHMTSDAFALMPSTGFAIMQSATGRMIHFPLHVIIFC